MFSEPPNHPTTNPPNMKLLVTGGSGYLGARILMRAPKTWKMAATYFAHPIAHGNAAAFRVDVRDAEAVHRVVAQFRPAVVIHTAAQMTGDQMPAVNVDGARNVASAAARAGARLIHLSSDVIFDGEHAPYGERAAPHPISPYADSKARAERAVIDECPLAVIVRTSLIYGFDPLDPRTRQTLDGAMPRLFTDEYRCPIFVADLADALLEIAQTDFTGIINVAGPQRLSRYAFGVALSNAFQRALRFAPARSESFPAPRPRDCTLDISLAQRILKTRLRGVDQVVADFQRIRE
ncbi:MAG TPA: SDR family oxidoreductase [Anaerolineae bacterium]